MSVQESREKLVARIWQAIAQSGLNSAAIPKDQWEKFVQDLADGVLLEMDELLNNVSTPGEAAARMVTAGAPQASGGEEQVLWEGRPFLSLNTRYIVTTERLRIISGLVGKGREDIELVRVKDLDHHQGIGERVLNIGDIYVHSADSSQPDIVLSNVRDPDQVHEIIRRAVLNARKRYPFIFEQEM